MLTNRNNPARAMVAYLWEEMCRLHASELFWTVLQWGSKAYLLLRNNGKPFTSWKPNPRRWNAKLWAPFWGELDNQLPGVANWSYCLRLTRMIARWKDLSEDYDGKDDFYQKNRWRWISQKTSFRASKRLRKFRTRKTAKNSKLRYN